mgnify:CR=1 FL=1
MRLERPTPVDLEGVPGVAMSMLTPGTSAERVRVDVAVVEAGGSLPRHPAGREQVFYVVSGHGRVAGEDGVEHPITPGTAAVWSRGEQHTSWADAPMTVVIIQRAPAE